MTGEARTHVASRQADETKTAPKKLSLFSLFSCSIVGEYNVVWTKTLIFLDVFC